MTIEDISICETRGTKLSVKRIFAECCQYATYTSLGTQHLGRINCILRIQHAYLLIISSISRTMYQNCKMTYYVKQRIKTHLIAYTLIAQ